ncbi:hypothetical protein Tco_1500475 [Tanacetum coccineum]
MDDPNITLEEYIRLEEEKAQNRGKVFNWETVKYGKIWYDEDVHDLRSVKTKFRAIAFNDQISSEKTLSCEPTVSSLNDEINFRILFGDSDDDDHKCLSGDNPECIFNFVIEYVFPDCLYSVSKPHGYGVLTFCINTTYPGEWIQRIDFLYRFSNYGVLGEVMLKRHALWSIIVEFEKGLLISTAIQQFILDLYVYQDFDESKDHCLTLKYTP